MTGSFVWQTFLNLLRVLEIMVVHIYVFKKKMTYTCFVTVVGRPQALTNYFLKDVPKFLCDNIRVAVS